MVPMYSAADFFSGKKDAKPVGWMSDPDEPGPVIVDQKTATRPLEKVRPKATVVRMLSSMPKVSAAPGGRPFIIHMRKDHVKKFLDAVRSVD